MRCVFKRMFAKDIWKIFGKDIWKERIVEKDG
jgi:hypothetical protein